MEKMVEFIVKGLVDHPEDVVIKTTQQDREVQILVDVNPEDIGKVIGKGGRIANAIRSVARALANRQNLRVSIKIGK